MELEVKYKVDSFPKSQINEMGFVKKKTSHQIDRYYIVDKLLSNRRTYLRIREDIQKNEYSFDFHQIVSSLATEETEISLHSKGDVENFEKILKALGYPLICIVDKKREVYEKKSIKIALDSVKNLGAFIEIEIEGEETIENKDKLKSISNKLNLNYENLILNVGYPDMLIDGK